MAYSVEMPELGESVTEGTVTQWLKKVGDTVTEDEPLLEVSTDKVDTEIPSPASGVLLEILANEDDTVDVGSVIALIGDPAEQSEAWAQKTPTPSEKSESEKKADKDSTASSVVSESSEPSQPEADTKEEPEENTNTTTPTEAIDVEMPELGESVTEGTVTQWLKKVGDTVTEDEPLLEVSTDKVDTEIPSPASGVLLEILANEDDTVDVGSVIARIGDPTKEKTTPSTTNTTTEETAKQTVAAGASAAAATNDSATTMASNTTTTESTTSDSEETSVSSVVSESSEPSQPEADTKEEPEENTNTTTPTEAIDVEMPELGESVTEGTVTQWLKKVGDTVTEDEPLLEVSTDKVDTEIPSPASGVLLEILANEDDTVDVGSVIARIGDPTKEKTTPSTTNTTTEETAKQTVAAGASAGVTAAAATTMANTTTGESDATADDADTYGAHALDPQSYANSSAESSSTDEDTTENEDVATSSEEAKPESDADEKRDSSVVEESEEPTQEEETATGTTNLSSQSVESETVNSENVKKENTGNLPYVTPLVRKLADKHGVDLSTVTGSGVGGRIRKQDILDAAGVGSSSSAASSVSDAPTADSQQQEEEKPRSPESRWSTKSVDPDKAELRGTTRRVNRIRELTAKKTLESLHGAAQLTQLHEVDMTRIAELRAAHKPAFIEKYGVNLTYLPFFAKAMVEALISHPNVNASYDAEKKEMTYHDKVNLGIAIDTPAGLLSPVIHNAQDLSLPELAKAIYDLADRARNNKLKPQELSGGTFTITNIGSEGALSDTPILVPPQAAIVGTGAIVKRPVVITEDGIDSIAIRQMVYLPMTYDHQIVDGADAGRFMTTVRDRLETADFLEDLEL